MQVYIPPKQVHCMNPLVSYTIESEMEVETRSGNTEVPAVTLQTIADALRRAAVIDGYLPSVEILQGRAVRIHFPRAVVSYGTNGDIVPIYLPQVGGQCQDLAEELTRTFSTRRHSHHAYIAMLRSINRHLLNKITRVYFTEFTVLNDRQKSLATPSDAQNFSTDS